MKEKRSKEKKPKSYKKDKKLERRKRRPTSSSSSSSDEWVEKDSSQKDKTPREDWMAMTGMLKTYTKDDIHPKKEEKDKKHIDSYNPATSCRELNPYWKDGGSGLPLTAASYRQSKQFLKPSDDEDYYTSTKSNNRQSSSRICEPQEFLKPDEENYSRKPGLRRDIKSIPLKPIDDDDDKKPAKKHKRSHYLKPSDNGDFEQNYKNQDGNHHSRHGDRKSYNWKKCSSSYETRTADCSNNDNPEKEFSVSKQEISHKDAIEKSQLSGKYLSDEKMNKLGARIVKAEILGDTKLVAELKAKLEAAREYRKQNPDAKQNDNEDERIMLIATSSSGNSRPLASTSKGDAKSKGGKKKSDTHMSGERAKYYGNDDKYNLAQMFTNEKYGTNYDDDAELAKIASKSKNPNDDLEDIFMDEISKNRNEAKDNEAEKNRAIRQHVKMEKSLEGCEYCLDSKDMLKHLMVSCGTKVYVAVPARKSLVKDHCVIATIQHATCVTALDEDVWEEIMDYRKAITQFFDSQNKDVVFYETATRLHRFPHMVINCVPLPRDIGDMAAIYFMKALLECEAEWSMNKKVVDLKGKNIRRGVPKGLPYFWIDFGMDPGYAHVIEDQQLFPKTFAEETIAGILDLDHSHWKNPRKELGDAQRKKVLEFIKEWKTFDPVKGKE